MTNICKHCRHYKTKHLKGIIVAEYCKNGANSVGFLKCDGFSRSLKSRLGLVVNDAI